jgi:hypothetical protein
MQLNHEMKLLKLGCPFWRFVPSAMIFLTAVVGRNIFGPVIVEMRMHWTLGMVGRVFTAFYRFRFKGLIRLDQFFDTFFGNIFQVGKSLRISGLPGTVRANLAGISAEFIGPCFVSSTLCHKASLKSRVSLLDANDWKRFSRRKLTKT